jgi:hypothetical protein
MLNIYARSAVIITSLLLALGYGLGGQWLGILVSVLMGGLWVVAQHQGWRSIEALGLLVTFGLAAVGVLLELNSFTMLLGIAAGIAAWDIDRFRQRMRAVSTVEDEDALIRHHLQRLAIGLGIGTVLSLIAMGIRIPLGFGWVALIAFLAMFGLSQAIRILNRTNDES